MTTTDPFLARAKDFTLAALAVGYPSDDTVATLQQVGSELDGHRTYGPWLAAAVQGPERLRTAYGECFDVGKGHTPLYETEYGRMRGLSKGRDLADVVGFYTAFGFSLSDDEQAEMPDHLAVELEFYALLLYKQSLLREDPEGTAIVAKARRAFLTEHLGSFARAVAFRPQVMTHPIFGPLLHGCAALIETECALEGVTPAPLDFFADKQDEGDVACGACVDLPGMPS